MKFFFDVHFGDNRIDPSPSCEQYNSVNDFVKDWKKQNKEELTYIDCPCELKKVLGFDDDFPIIEPCTILSGNNMVGQEYLLIIWDINQYKQFLFYTVENAQFQLKLAIRRLIEGLEYANKPS